MKSMKKPLALAVLIIIGSSMAQAAPLSGDQQKMLTAVMTANTAIEFCGFAGKDKVAALSEAYGVSPALTDMSLVKPLIEQLSGEVSKNKQKFCDRAWSDYGEEGALVVGLLNRGREAPSPVDDWTVLPAQENGKFSHCLATRLSDRGTELIFAGIGSGMAFVGVYKGVALEAGKSHTFELDVGGEQFDIDTDEIEKGDKEKIGFPIKGVIADLLPRVDSFTLNIEGKTVHVPFGEGAKLLAKLESCVAGNGR